MQVSSFARTSSMLQASIKWRKQACSEELREAEFPYYKCILLLWELKWWAMWKGSWANKDQLDDIMRVDIQTANMSARNK